MEAWENLQRAAGVSPPKSSWERLKEAAQPPVADRQEQSAIAAERAHEASVPAADRQEQSAIKAQQAHEATQAAAAACSQQEGRYRPVAISTPRQTTVQIAVAPATKQQEGRYRPVAIPMPQQVETKPATPVSTPKAAQRSGNYNLQSLPDLGRGPSCAAAIENPIKGRRADERVWNRQISTAIGTLEKPKISTLPFTGEPPALMLLSATAATNQQEGRSRPTAVSTSKQRNKQSSLATERADEADKMMVPSESRQRQQALATERADEADKMLVPSASRQAAQSTTTSSAKSQEGRSRPVEIPMEQITQAELEARQKSAASAQTVNPGTSAKDYTAMADALEAEAKELFKEYSALTSAPRRGATANLAENRQEAARKLREYDEKQQEVKRLRELAAEAEVAEEQQKLLSYQEFLKNPDYAEKSQYKSTANGKEAKLNAWSGMYTETGFNDITYDYINGNKDAREKQMVNDISTNASLLGLDKSFLDEMTDAEVGLFNYVYATQGADEAYRFVKQLETNLTYRQRIKSEAEAAQYAAEHPVASSVLSVIESPLMKPLSYIGQLADYADDGKIDQNAGYNKYSYTNNAIRGQVSQIAEEKWGKPGSFLYNTGMSMGDFLFTTAITGGQEALSLAIMGTSAAADATIAAKDRGLSDDQAFAIGAIAGAAEIVTEKVSLDTLLDKTSLSKSAAGYFFKNMLAEGSEEVASDLINLLADVAISKDKSEWRTSVRAYMDQGMAEKEATGMAFADQAKSMGLDFLGGALSGGVMSGGNIVLNQAGATIENARQSPVSAEAATKAAQAVEELGAKPSEVKTVVEPNRLLGYSEQDVARREQLRTAERIAQKFGAELEVAELPSGVDGEYRDGKITISPRATNPVMTVAVHELTHHMESSGRYGEFSRIVLDYVSDEMGVDVDTMKNAIRAEYAKGGFELDDVGAERELVAKFAESKLFQDEAAINRLARTNRSIFQTVKDWISDMVVKLTGTEEEKFFRNAERMYEKALREVGDTANSNGGRVQYSMGDVDLQRNVIDYTDQTAQSAALRNAMQQQVSADKVVLVTAEEINAHQTGTDWSVAAKARKWLRDAVTAFMGDSVHFEINGGNLEAYLTSTAKNHFVRRSPTPEKAAAINRFYELIENAVYAYSAEHDVHSKAGENVEAQIWDYFICPVDFGNGPEPFLFSVRSIDRDTRAQIYSMAAQRERGSLRRNGSQETPVGRFSTYEGVSASQENDSTSAAKVNSEPGTLGDEQLRGQPSTSYADAVHEMQQPGARQSKSYADDLAHVNELLQNAALSPRDQAYIQEDIADAQRSCDAAMKAIANPGITSKERAQAVQRAIDAVDYARQRINDLGLPATQREASMAQDALADIAEKLKPYLDNLGGFREP